MIPEEKRMFRRRDGVFMYKTYIHFAVETWVMLHETEQCFPVEHGSHVLPGVPSNLPPQASSVVPDPQRIVDPI